MLNFEKVAIFLFYWFCSIKVGEIMQNVVNPQVIQASYPVQGDYSNSRVLRVQYELPKEKSEVKKPKGILIALSIAGIVASSILGKKASTMLHKLDSELGLELKDVKKVADKMIGDAKIDKPANLDSLMQGAQDASSKLYDLSDFINSQKSAFGKAYSKVTGFFENITPKLLKDHLGFHKPENLAFWGLIGIDMFGNSANRKSAYQQDGEKPSFGKFLNDNFGKIAALVYAPMVLKEISAAHRVMKSASKLDKSLISPIRKGIASKFAGPVVSSLIMFSALIAGKKYSNQVTEYNKDQRDAYLRSIRG